MSFDDIRSASIIRYPYLWSRQARKGESEGRKERPVAVAFRLSRKCGGDVLILLAITSQLPQADYNCIEIPDTEKQRAGLNPDKRAWVMLNEYNEDLAGHSYYLQPGSKLGNFSKPFFVRLIRKFIKGRETTNRISRH